VKFSVSEERLKEHEQEESYRQSDEVPTHATNDRGNQHQDRDQMEDDEAPLPVRLDALPAQYAETGEQKLDRHCE